MESTIYILFNATKARFGEWTNSQGACRGPLVFSDFESAQRFVRRLGKPTKGYRPLAKLMSEIISVASDFRWTHIWTRESVPLSERAVFRGIPINLDGAVASHDN